MPTYIGENKIVDRYLGDRFLEAAYIGDKKVYDPYTEITGYLPIIYKSRAAVALKNYRIYGTSAGAGVETENLWDNNNLNMAGNDNPEINVSGNSLTLKGNSGATNLYYSPTLFPAGTYTLAMTTELPFGICYVVLGSNSPISNVTLNGGNFSASTTVTGIMRTNYGGYKLHNSRIQTATIISDVPFYLGLAPNTASFTASNIMLVEGSTAPSTYIPHGYKLPLTVESGVTENLWDDDYTGISSAVTYRPMYVGEGNWTLSTTTPLTTDNSALLFLFSGIVSSGGSTAVNGVSINNPKTFAAINGYVTVGYRGYGSVTPVNFQTMLVKGSTAPDHYIPHRYTSNYDLFIGDSKLGEEEYVDFGEQKVYKRTGNLFDKDAKDTNNGYINDTFLYSSGATRSNKAYYVSEYIQINPNTVYFLKDLITTAISASLCFYDNEKNFISGAALINLKNIISPGNARYLRTSILKTNEDIAEITSLQPTDPPVPLPPIPTFKGENTLSSTEMLGEVTVKGRIKEKPIVYGWHVDPSISDPAQAITYLGDAVGKTPAAMGSETFSYGDWENAFFMPKPCMLRSDGTVAYYLDPNDYTKKADGTASDVANSSFDGNAMMEWPLIWYKFEAGAVDGEVTFHCSNKKIDETYNCWCNYDANDNIIPHFYTAIYNGTGTEKMRSLSGIQLTSANGNGSTTGQQEVARATANNITSDIEWYTDVYSDRQLISALLILMSKCTDDQAAYGRGLDTGSQTYVESYITGTLNDKGLFYGVTANGNSAVKVFGMENWFGCKWRRTAGLVGGANYTYLYKLTYGTADGSTIKGYNSNGQGYLIANGVLRPVNNYVTKMGAGKHGILPKETAAVSSSLYYGVYYYNGSGYALFGGSSYNGLYVGSLCVGLSNGLSYSYWLIGASLSCKPAKKT